MKVETYADWKQVITEQRDKLWAVRCYLSEDGKERLRAFYTLESYAAMCDTAAELAEWVFSDLLDEDAKKAFASHHVAGALAKLRRIAG